LRFAISGAPIRGRVDGIDVVGIEAAAWVKF